MEESGQQRWSDRPPKLPRCCSVFVKKRGLTLVTVLQSESN